MWAAMPQCPLGRAGAGLDQLGIPTGYTMQSIFVKYFAFWISTF